MQVQPRVGTPEMASKALTAHALHENGEALGAGWKYLARGVSRAAYLAPDGVVYKVALRGYDSCNEVEENAVAHANSRTDGTWYAAPCEVHYVEGRPVAAMAYIEETLEDSYRRFEECYGVLEQAGFSDLHSGNFRLSRVGGLPVMIDVGFGLASGGYDDAWADSSPVCSCSLCEAEREGMYDA